MMVAFMAHAGDDVSSCLAELGWMVATMSPSIKVAIPKAISLRILGCFIFCSFSLGSEPGENEAGDVSVAYSANLVRSQRQTGFQSEI